MCSKHQNLLMQTVRFYWTESFRFQTPKIFQCGGFICRVLCQLAEGNLQLSAGYCVHFRKLCRSIVGPAAEVDWNEAWDEVFHLWNERVRGFVASTRANTWRYIACKKNIRNLARHVATLPAHRWVQRLLSWRPFGARRAGRPRHTWESKLEAYCGHTNMGSWREAALDEIVWN